MEASRAGFHAYARGGNDSEVIRWGRPISALVGTVTDCPHCYRSVAIAALDDERVMLADHDDRNNDGPCNGFLARVDDVAVACDDGQHGDCQGWVHGTHPPSRGDCTCECHG